MSGGRFGYNQYHLSIIAESIESELNKQGALKPKDELWGDEEYYKRNPAEKYFKEYPAEIQEKFKEAIRALKIAEIYAQRVDWYLSGDDSDEGFLEQLSEELNEVK